MARFDDTYRGGGIVAQGASIAGREDAVANATASITIAGIPAGSTVSRAVLYWVISGGTDTTATIGATAVTGVLLGTGGDTVLGREQLHVSRGRHRAGHGQWRLHHRRTAIVDGRDGADTDGVALVVAYQNVTSGIRRRVMIRDGAITTSGTGEVVTDTFAGVTPHSRLRGQFHIVVGDGQTVPDGVLTFNAVSLGTSQFQGSDGNLWDTNSYNVTVPARACKRDVDRYNGQRLSHLRRRRVGVERRGLRRCRADRWRGLRSGQHDERRWLLLDMRCRRRMDLHRGESKRVHANLRRRDSRGNRAMRPGRRQHDQRRWLLVDVPGRDRL